MFNIKPYFYVIKHFGWKRLLLVMALSLLTYTIALAASGDLDPTFSGDGKLTTDIGGWNDRANAVAIQSDGKIVTVGDHYNAAGDKSDIAVIRYKPGGALDTTFNGDGKLSTNFGGMEYASDIAIQSNGKIIVAGQTIDASWVSDLALARYNQNGSLDTTFGEDGKVTIDFGGGTNGSNGGLAIQSDGKIVIAGFMQKGSNVDFAVYRLNPSGTLDATFSGDGMVNTGFGSGRHDMPLDLAITSGGKLVVSGYTCESGHVYCNFAVARFNPNGSLDTTFSADGKVTTDFGWDERGCGVIIQSNGKIVVAGNSWIFGNDSRFALARYNSNGSLDTTFSGDGKVLTDLALGVPDWAQELVIQTNGKLMVTGETGYSGSRDFILARYNSNGSLDNTFSGNGWLTTNFGGDDSASDIVIQANGRLLVAGGTNVGSGADWNFALARYLP